jgi:hypothetical protein
MLPLVSAGPFALEPIPGVGSLLFHPKNSLEELWAAQRTQLMKRRKNESPEQSIDSHGGTRIDTFRIPNRKWWVYYFFALHQLSFSRWRSTRR